MVGFAGPFTRGLGCHDTGSPKGPLVGVHSSAVFPLEVKRRLRGDSARALVQGLSALNEDLFAGHAGLRDALTAEVKARSDAKKAPALARDVRAQAQGAGGAAPARRRPPRPTPGGYHPRPLQYQEGFRACEARPGLVACQCTWVT